MGSTRRNPVDILNGNEPHNTPEPHAPPAAIAVEWRRVAEKCLAFLLSP